MYGIKKNMFWILCFLNVLGLSCQEELKYYTQASAAELPFQALIFNNDKGWYTVGALISPNYVVTMANGIKKSVHFVVYLGLSTHPQAVEESSDETVQVISSSHNILIHEDYGMLNSTGQYIYDIGLLQLDREARVTGTVQVLNLPPKSMFPLKAGLLANSTAFKLNGNERFPAYAQVQLRSQAKCKLFFGSTFLDSEEICVRQHILNADFSKKFIYLPLVADGYLIGLGRTRLTPAACQVTSATCNFMQVYTSLENSLDWIHENTDIANWIEKQNMLKTLDLTTARNEDSESNFTIEEGQDRTSDKDIEDGVSNGVLPQRMEVDGKETEAERDGQANNTDKNSTEQVHYADQNRINETTAPSTSIRPNLFG